MSPCLYDPAVVFLAAWTSAAGVAGFAAMALDKAGAAGGFPGVMLASEALHHKTAKLRFTLLVWAAAFPWLSAFFELVRVTCLGLPWAP
ncbi:MAG: DUF1294 domain-containing protein [Nitrososphaerota archaeon]|nr:DUF1294 domain-containing protein [Nitrososphaerota archaeon]MDG6939616.1 DUF1294 domain-containing protein [Nitrososphaerota archaeon]